MAAGAYQRPREKNPSSRSTSTMIRMIQRIDTEEPPWSLSESKRETLPIGYGLVLEGSRS